MTTKNDFRCPFEDQAIPKWMNGDAPWVIRLGVWLVSKFGLTVILLGLIVAIWSGYIPSPITENHRMLINLSTARKGEVKLLRAICRHTSITDIQRKDCDDAAGE